MGESAYTQCQGASLKIQKIIHFRNFRTSPLIMLDLVLKDGKAL